MEVFDQASFDQHKEAGHRTFTAPDGSQVEQWEAPNEYYLEVTWRGRTNYSTYRMFYFDSRRLRTKGDQFCNFPIGVWRTYDRSGAVTEEVDHDAPFKLGVADIERLMAKRGVDIMTRGNSVGVLREDSLTPTYTVLFPEAPGGKAETRLVTVDGTSGQIVSETVKRRIKD